MDTASDEEDFEAWVAYREAKRAKKGGGGSEQNGIRGKREASEEGRTTNGFNGETGERDRCYTCNSEYHFVPHRPQTEKR